jgi:hypothetical protein
MASKMTGMAGDVTSKAGQHWDKLESIFEERTAKALAKLGVPSAKDVAALHKRIDELSAQLGKAGKAPAPRAATAKTAAKTTAKTATKPAAKKAARKTA